MVCVRKARRQVYLGLDPALSPSNSVVLDKQGDLPIAAFSFPQREITLSASQSCSELQPLTCETPGAGLGTQQMLRKHCIPGSVGAQLQ